MPKKLILTIVALFLVSFFLNGECSDKTIFDSNWIVPEDYLCIDRTKAYNDVASCDTLTTEEEKVCCYLK